MYYFGTSGWYYDDWIDRFYPKNIKKKQWLKYYSQFFDTVEVNSTFYRLPFPNMVKGWFNKTPDNFVLTFKGNQMITHRKKLHDVESYVNQFYKRIKPAVEKIGVILWQLPPNLSKNLHKLESFLNILDNKISQVIEFRHKTWFEKDTYQLLEKYNVGFCIISCPDFDTDIITTTDYAYIRWHGKNSWYRYNYSHQELKKWADIIQKLNVKDVYGYFNNDFDAYAIENCNQIKNMLKIK